MTGLLRRWRSWTLRRQLVIGVSVAVMSVLLTLGTLSILTLRNSVNGMVDSQLSVAANGYKAGVTKFRTTPTSTGQLPPPGATKPLVQFIGQAPGNVIALVRNGRVVDSALFADGDAGPAPAAAVDKIAATAWTDGEAHTVWLPGLGKYLMKSTRGDTGETLITGVSLRPADDAVTRQTTLVAALTALALLITALATWAIVRFALRPLRRVAATAADVAALPLNRDQYTIAPRVQPRDTDARTEVGLVGDALNRLLAHVERALGDVAASDRRMRRFITDASHELRTPLAAIHGYAELTRQDSAVLPETTEYSLARIESEANRMNRLVADLLLLARLDEGEDLDCEDVDLTELVVDAVNDAAVSAPTHSWLTDVDCTVFVRGDRTRLHQLLANLLSNARTHTPDGTTVTTGLTVDVGHVDLTVVDDGPGIAPDLLPHLFERFVRADESRSSQTGSFGLGLSIAASIVEAHDGSITAESVAGRTAFRVRMPLI